MYFYVFSISTAFTSLSLSGLGGTDELALLLMVVIMGQKISLAEISTDFSY